MKFYNILQPEKKVTLAQAVITGIQGSEGLFMPENIPPLAASFFDDLPNLSLQEISIAVAEKFLGEDLSRSAIQNIINESLNFEIPLKKICENLYVLELFHGPTLAFKDVGARFMARLFSVLHQNFSNRLQILVATSGDTGGAVANAFWGMPEIAVTILYPSGKVSLLQEKQLTTLGGNVTALEVRGTFDDCQRLVKQAFADLSLIKKIHLASANSINLARLIPQSFYYFWAVAQVWKIHGKKPVAVSVPSGNFGNLTAGVIAQKMGLPISKFIAATNANRVVPHYLKTGSYEPKPTVQTISNAMDVGNPSNFERLNILFQKNWQRMKNSIEGFSFDDQATQNAMREMKTHYHYIADPHGAVGYLALKEYVKHRTDIIGIFLETAHPAKFIDVVEATLGEKIRIPETLAQLLHKPKSAVEMEADYESLKAFLS